MIKVRNFRTLVNYSLAFLKTPLASTPLEIQVELSSACNLNCQMCSLKKSTQKNKFLTPDNFEKIIQEFKPQKVNLTGMGESLLNPHFEKIIEICHTNKIAYSFISNLQLLNSKNLLALKKYPAETISVSMESGIEKTYEKIRRGAKYQKTVTNLKTLQKLISTNSLKTELVINIVYLDFNLKKLQHLTKIIDLAYELKIHKITSQNTHLLSPYFKKLYHQNKMSNIFSILKNYADSKNINFLFPNTKVSHNHCYYPWVYPQITSNGEVLPCCVIPQFGSYDTIVKKYSFGNVINQPIRNIWNNLKARKFRQLHSNTFPCKYCSKNKGIL